ncbi:RNA-binding ribosome biosynthesis protein MAK21 [Spizellomyces punctatus DAOM BR117]|uniref:CCAAT-binding factor domain-containing protein n=1 Tax=Spizellomyces punctatus (strain DAOM BR117) TaxID=645134 RepID=A0A0L0HA05_SPIPD|nr:RNA-binding ribosome biosynthesis protein MAK21 [Spizellomyces punctatus DAOM BR117]KNC97841.1 hypothetical protein SPPG_06837 [Spizellomyces punctatus DAOM BR117]|eukprot:XP_016605881.1 hypothetical protein SPPG_06837 [Spizellomyces punctatus DAOM BR117]
MPAQKAKAKKTPPVSKKSKRSILLQEILSLGGEESDLAVIADALSGSEAEDNGVQTRRKERKEGKEEEDEGALLKELMGFMNGVGIDPKKSVVEEVDDEEGEGEDGGEDVDQSEGPQGGEQEEEDEDAEEGDEDAEDDHEDDEGAEEEGNDQLKYGKEDANEVRSMVSQLLQGQTVDDKLSKKMIFEPTSRWYDHPLPPITGKPNTSESTLQTTYTRAKTLWTQESAEYTSLKSRSADKDFISTVLKSGTVTDKVSALTLLVQESPLHTLHLLRDQLVNGMARKKARREAVLAMDSVKDLMVGTLLPDRKLRYFRDQPLDSPHVKPVHLVAWYFEDGLKKTYFEFIQLIEELARDPLLHIKNKMIQYIYDLLSSKPEQEQNLLSLLVNKVGDQDRKLASKSAHLLSQLLATHPAMKLVVIKEVERLLFRPNVTDRARYYAVTFLNQIVLSHREADVAAANRLVDVYFSVFDGLGKRMEAAKMETDIKSKNGKNGKKKGKKGNKNAGKGAKKAEVVPQDPESMTLADGIDAKMMAALLTGVNRAFPFAKIEDDVFDKHMKTLFTVSHIGTFNTSIQALTLIFQVQSSRQSLSDRFYRTLYASLLDPRLYTASKQAMYLNLLYRALKADTSLNRVKSFIKRLVQVCAYVQVPFVCAGLFLVGEVAKVRPGIWGMVNQAEEDGDVEVFVDVDEDGEVFKPDVKKVTQGYDGRKRDPLYCNAEKTCLWELTVFSTHFHPTVSLYAKTLLSGTPIAPPPNATNYDPLQNHALSRFLDRFIFKNPKKVSTAYKGTSLMQPRVAGLSLSGREEEGHERILSAARKRGVVLENEEIGNKLPLDDTPVNIVAQKWLENPESVPVDEVFYYQYFKEKARDTNKIKKKKQAVEELDAADDEDEEEMDEDLVWEAMQKSAGFDPAGEDEDGDEDLLGDEDDELSLEDIDSDEDNVEGENDEDDHDLDDVYKAMDGIDAASGSLSDNASGDDDDDEMAKWAQDSNEDTNIPSGDDEYDDDDDDASFANMITAEEASDSESKKPKKPTHLSTKARALGYKGTYFDTKSAFAFADADEFLELIEREDGLDTGDGAAAPVSKRKGEKRKRESASMGQGKKKRVR